ncbi:cellulose biosynthesis protein BcsQ [Frateuria defendens]|uniref:cellulose biosynthesis protein BcsQ n=1 Tax=Frateuria defendens TaxID=2219559 RepID=UPI00066FF484|nr:cellulose biosynthesis protein BcsQ [Frateuria defendens]
MSSLALHGVRGGAGTSSLLAGLGYALHQLGQRVLLVDLCPENLLRLHFNLDLALEAGWARADLDQRPWHEAAYRVLPNLHLLPYGRVSPGEYRSLEQRLAQAPERWAQRRQNLEERFDWVLFDLPQRLPGHVRPFLGHDGCRLQLRTVNVDPACYALLALRGDEPPHGERLLVNRYDPAHPLERDLMQVWLDRYEDRLVPQAVHEDTAMREAMAHQMPVGHHAPHSLAAKELASVATWCLAQVARRGRGAEVQA